MKKVLVTGATGFTGSYVVPLLLKDGYQVRCLVRPSSEKSILDGYEIEWIYGDLTDIESLTRAMNEVDVLVNVASIGFGYAPNIVRSAETAGVKRAVFVSTTAIFTTLDASSKTVRLAAEKIIRESSLPYTILRPTMIYGSARDRNMCRLIRYLQRWPVIPVFGNGKYLQQPVYVEDVAGAIVQVLSVEQTIGSVYNIPGVNALTYNEVLDTVCRQLHRHVKKIHLPVAPIVKTLRFIEKLGLRAPLKAEQILRLNEHKAFDFDEASRDFGYSPRYFEEGMASELETMGISQNSLNIGE